MFDEDARRVPLSRFRLHCGERFRYEYDFSADWNLDIRLEKVLPFDPRWPIPLCPAGRRAAPPEYCRGVRDYLERLDRHRYPFEAVAIVAEAVQRLLDSEGDRKAIDDLDELRESLERVEAYENFQPDRFERRQVNQQLRASNVSTSRRCSEPSRVYEYDLAASPASGQNALPKSVQRILGFKQKGQVALLRGTVDFTAPVGGMQYNLKQASHSTNE